MNLLHASLKWGLLVLFSLIGLHTWRYIHEPNFLPISEVKVIGNIQFISKSSIQKKVLPYVNKGFFNVDVANIITALQKFPSIEHIKVHRIWPHSVSINITEKPVLAYFYPSELITQKGKLFTPNKKNKSLNFPTFYGPKEDIPELINLYRAISPILDQHDLHIHDLKQNSYGEFTVTLSQSLILFLGDQNILNKIKLFTEAIHTLKALNHKKEIEYIDMRYTNGFAVKWRNKTKMSM